MRTFYLSLLPTVTSLGLLALTPVEVQAQRFRGVMPVRPVMPVAPVRPAMPVHNLVFPSFPAFPHFPNFPTNMHGRFPAEFGFRFGFGMPANMTSMPFSGSGFADPYMMGGGYGGGYGGGGYGGGGYGQPPSSSQTQTSSAASMTRPSYAPAEAGTVIDVNVSDSAFQPRAITVTAGTTVRWTNRGSVRHTVTSDAGLFDSGELAPGATSNYTFNKRGDFFIHSNDNPRVIQGIVTVQ
jgi:plastocyanin